MTILKAMPCLISRFRRMQISFGVVDVKSMRILLVLGWCGCLAFFFCGFLFTASGRGADSDRSTLNKIRDSSLGQVKLVRSIECRTGFESRTSLGSAAVSGLPAKVREDLSKDMVLKGEVFYAELGNKYRVETALAGASTGSGDTEVHAYNGDRYQALMKEKKALAYKKTPMSLNPVRGLSPLTMPYHWLFDEKSINVLSEIKNDRRWNEQFELASYRGQRESNGMTVDVVEFPYPFKKDLPESMQDAVVQVHFVETLGYYPIASMAMDQSGRVFGEVRVVNYKEFFEDGQKVVIPLEVKTTMSVPGQIESIWTLTIAQETIKINHDIDEDLFTISTTLASIVEDADETAVKPERLDKGSRERQKTSDIRRRDFRTFPIVITCSVVVFLILLAIVYRLK